MEDEIKDSGWHYAADGDYPDDMREVAISAVSEEHEVRAFLCRTAEGAPMDWNGPHTGYRGQRTLYALADVYAWRELPPKAPRREEER